MYSQRNEATVRRTKLGLKEQSYGQKNKAAIRRTKLRVKNEATDRRTKSKKESCFSKIFLISNSTKKNYRELLQPKKLWTSKENKKNVKSSSYAKKKFLSKM